MLLKRKQTSTSHFCLIILTTIVGCSMHDCHCRKRLYLSHSGRVTGRSQPVCFPFFFNVGDTTRKNKTSIDGKICEWRNPKQNPLGQQYPQSCVSAPFSAGPIPYRGQVHLVLSAPACLGAAVTQFGAPWLEESLSVLARFGR